MTNQEAVTFFWGNLIEIHHCKVTKEDCNSKKCSNYFMCNQLFHTIYSAYQKGRTEGYEEGKYNS